MLSFGIVVCPCGSGSKSGSLKKNNGADMVREPLCFFIARCTLSRLHVLKAMDRLASSNRAKSPDLPHSAWLGELQNCIYTFLAQSPNIQLMRFDNLPFSETIPFPLNPTASPRLKMSTNLAPPDLKQRLKKSYDAIATRYNAWTIPNSQQRLQYLDKILALVGDAGSSPRSVLELGCGCGVPVTQKLLSHDHYHVTANDLSSTQIEAARENLKGYENHLRLMEGDMALLEFSDGSFDMVVGMYSLIHLPRAEQQEMFQKIAKWLKPGGYLLANFSAEATEGVVFEKWLADEGWVFWSGFGSEETTTKVKEAGLTVLVSEVSEDAVAASFLWIIAKKDGPG